MDLASPPRLSELIPQNVFLPFSTLYVSGRMSFAARLYMVPAVDVNIQTGRRVVALLV